MDNVLVSVCNQSTYQGPLNRLNTTNTCDTEVRFHRGIIGEIWPGKQISYYSIRGRKCELGNSTYMAVRQFIPRYVQSLVLHCFVTTFDHKKQEVIYPYPQTHRLSCFTCSHSQQVCKLAVPNLICCFLLHVLLFVFTCHSASSFP